MATTLQPAPYQPLFRTSIGRKLLMAISGIVLILFVIAHMIGNLKVFLGASEINRYAEGLRTMAEPIFPRSWVLWIIRSVLIVAFIAHVWTSIELSLKSRAARQQRYVHTDHVQADIASTTMRWGGLAILLFVAFHLAHFTWGWLHPGYVYIRGDVYHNMVEGFRVWWISSLYILAMIALGLHIYHGSWSIFQTFGVNSRRWDRTIRRGATTLAALIVAGNCSMPIAVLFHVVK